ncbi:hypothetical protein FRC02_011381 [Tulasnella sp. 418]|nr:hypothetical protein FRC02_011381 [Tulasnella sp. 418]
MVSQAYRAIRNSCRILGANQLSLRSLSSASAVAKKPAHSDASVTKEVGAAGFTSTSPLSASSVLKSSADLLSRCVELPDSTFWLDRVEASLRDIQRPRPPTIAIWGDSKSGATDLVTALLEDPLSDDSQRRTALHGRLDGDSVQQSPLRIRFGADNRRLNNELHLGSPFLQRSGTEIVELNDSDPSNVLPHLLLSDIIVLVTDNVRYLNQPGLLPLLHQFSRHPRAYLFVNRLSSSGSALQEENHIDSTITRLFEDSLQPILHDSYRIKVYSGSSDLAIEAIEIFRDAVNSETSPSSKAAALDTYQAKYLASRLTMLASQISTSIPPALQRHTAEGCPLYQYQSANFLASSALHACEESVASVEMQIAQAQERVEHIKDISDHVAQELHNIPRKAQSPTLSQEASIEQLVRESLQESSQQAEYALQQFSWWKLPWKVDDLQDRMIDAVLDHYAKELERKLLVLSGALVMEQARLWQETKEAVTFPSESVFSSRLLINSLDQMHKEAAHRPQDHISHELTKPIEYRRAQLSNPVASPVSYLYLRAQNLVSSTYIIGFSSVGGAWGAWITDYASTEMALGIGGLGVAGAVRWCVGRWNKTKKRFWADWNRVEEGLERDIKVEFCCTSLARY